jgi:hypothetical protein
MEPGKGLVDRFDKVQRVVLDFQPNTLTHPVGRGGQRFVVAPLPGHLGSGLTPLEEGPFGLHGTWPTLPIPSQATVDAP